MKTRLGRTGMGCAMSQGGTAPLFHCCAIVVCLAATIAADEPDRMLVRKSIEKGIRFLRPHVVSWPSKSRCYACHHHGDGVTALMRASKAGFAVDLKQLTSVRAWLVRPNNWDKNGGEQQFNDKRLSSIQFALAIESIASVSPELVKREDLREAGNRVLRHQSEQGSWPTIREGSLDGPVTYGESVATARCKLLLDSLKDDAFQDPRRRAIVWLQKRKVERVLDASSVLLAISNEKDKLSLERCELAVKTIIEANDRDGGWGPFKHSRSECFDSALAIWALSRLPRQLTPSEGQRQTKGVRYLLGQQLDDGSWPETTRPAGELSHAHHISTTAWVVTALVEHLVRFDKARAKTRQ